jgi:hypothetical protein
MSKRTGFIGRSETRHGFGPARHIVNRACVDLTRSPGRVWAEGVLPPNLFIVLLVPLELVRFCVNPCGFGEIESN